MLTYSLKQYCIFVKLPNGVLRALFGDALAFGALSAILWCTTVIALPALGTATASKRAAAVRFRGEAKAKGGAAARSPASPPASLCAPPEAGGAAAAAEVSSSASRAESVEAFRFVDFLSSIPTLVDRLKCGCYMNV